MLVGGSELGEPMTTDGMLREVLPQDAEVAEVDRLSELRYFGIVNANPEPRKLVLPGHLEREKFTVMVRELIFQGARMAPDKNVALTQHGSRALELSLLPLCRLHR